MPPLRNAQVKITGGVPATKASHCRTHLVSKLSEGADVFSGGADRPLVELVLERLHDGGGVANRVDQDHAQTPGNTDLVMPKPLLP